MSNLEDPVFDDVRNPSKPSTCTTDEYVAQVRDRSGRQSVAEAINTIAKIAEDTFGEPISTSGPRKKFLQFSIRDQFAVDCIDELNRQGWMITRVPYIDHRKYYPDNA